MIVSYDWLFHAQRNPALKKQIEDAVASGGDCELTWQQILRIGFEGKTQSAVVRPYAADSDFHAKVISVRISYRAIIQIINGDLDHLNDADFQWLNE